MKKTMKILFLMAFLFVALASTVAMAGGTHGGGGTKGGGGGGKPPPITQPTTVIGFSH